MTSPYTEALGDTLIERTRRERIVLVAVTLPPPRTPRRTRRSTNWPCLPTRRERTQSPASFNVANARILRRSSARAKHRK